MLFKLAYDLTQAAILLGICVAIEHVAAIERYSLRQRVPGALFQATALVIGSLIAWSIHRGWVALGVPIVPIYDWLPFWAYVLALLILTDFFIYWRHRAEHKWFWPIHAVHHSPRELHAANDIGHPLQVIPDTIMVWLPMSFFQMHGPETPIAIGLLSALQTMYIHSPIDFHFGPLRRVIVDNRYHRIHHSLEPQHFEKNFAVCFSVWDQLFGTAYFPEKQEWPAVGVAEVPAPKTVRDFLAIPFRMLRNAPDEHVRKVVVGVAS